MLSEKEHLENLDAPENEQVNNLYFLKVSKTLNYRGITLEEKVDTIIAISTNGANGPFIYHYDESLGAFPTETDDKYAASGIELKWGKGILDTQVFGIKACGSDNRKVEMDYSDSSEWIDFYSDTTHDKKLENPPDEQRPSLLLLLIHRIPEPHALRK